MLEFRDLPLIVNEQIVHRLFKYTPPLNRRLNLLGVCRDWRQIALPLIYDTLIISESGIRDHISIKSQKPSNPSSRCWYLNIAPFNAHDVALHAKKLRLAIHSPEGLEELKTSLEYVSSLNPNGWKSLSKLKLWISSACSYTDGKKYSSQSSLLISASLFNAFPGITEFKLESSSPLKATAYLFSQLLTSYSVNVYTLSILCPVAFSDTIHLQNLTVLDLNITKDKCQLLSFVDPQILRKLSIECDIGIYVWQYFTSGSTSEQPLNFAMLTELNITSSGYIEDEDGGYVSQSSDDFEAESQCMSEIKRLCKDWAHVISERRVLLPRLEVFRIDGGHLSALLFKNCAFPDNIHELELRDSASLITYSIWLLSHISADHVSVEVHSDSDHNHYIVRFLKTLGPGIGNKINNLELDLYLRMDSLVFDLPILRTLYIYSVGYSTVTALIRTLPALRRLTLRNIIKDDGSPCSDPLVFDQLLESPLNFSISTLVVQLMDFVPKELGVFYIKCLVVSLPKLHYVALGNKFIETLQTFVADNQDKYAHFKSMLLTRW